MLHPSRLPALCLALSVSLLGAAAVAHADSLASSASSAGSQVSGSVSDSLGASSNSSTGDKKVAEGAYRVTEVAEVTPGTTAQPQVILTLQGRDPGTTAEFTLKLPRAAMGDQLLARGDLVQVRAREYGYDFARGNAAANANAAQPFFLVLKDDWHRELGAHVVTL